MILKDITFQTPEENISYDNVLLESAEKGELGEVLRFWESAEPFIVLGRVSKPEQDILLEKISRDRIAIVRRSSGGGTVLQGKGCLNYSLILSKNIHPQIVDLRQSYQWILGNVITALNHLEVNAVFRPLSDIALVKDEKKISGNAQKRGKNFILHHGTLLYNFDLAKITEYLTMPKDIPEYRQNRTHKDFVANIPASAEALKKEISNIFQASTQKINNKETVHIH